MGQTENTSLRYHPHWRKNAYFARTVMRSAGITAAAAVGYYSPSGFLPALVSPFTARSAAALSPIRGSLKVSCAITPLTQRFLKYGVIVSPFLQMSRKNFIGRRYAPVYSVIALSRQAFCSYTFFIFSQRKDGENVAECYKTIEYPDRKAIAALYAAGAKAGQIAKEIGVAPRTIYAELKRGREGDKLDKNFRPSYDADLAQKRAQESLRRRGRRKGGPAE